MTKNKINKIVSILLIVSLIFCSFMSFADGIDVNVSGGEGEGYTGGGAGGSNAIVGDLELKGARVSLWDVETQEKIGDARDMVDFSRKSYEEVSKFRRLSGLTKPQIMSLNENTSDTMDKNIKDYTKKEKGYIDYKAFNNLYESYKIEYNEKKALLEVETDEAKKDALTTEINYLEKEIAGLEGEKEKYNYEPNYEKMGSYLCSESIQFPELYMRTTSTGQMETGEGAEYANKKENERIEGIKNFYKNEENTYKLIAQFSYENNIEEKFKEGKICILLEPLLCFCNKAYLPDSYWMMTSAEIGLLAINGYDDVNKVGYEKGVSTNINKTIVNKNQLGGTAYKALPYGTFKENDGLIKAIKAYEYNGKAVTITNESGYRDMIKMMGCLEITAVKATESEIKIEFHPNGEQLSDEAGNYNKNKIDDSYTKIIKSNEKIKIDKTYSDNFFSDVYSDEHTYTRYNTKADMSGKYYSVDTENTFTEDTVLYVAEASEASRRRGL